MRPLHCWVSARLWSLKLSQTELMEIGSMLGADVPFFFVGGCALATGTGTELKAIADSDRKYLVIVTPNATVSTASAYEALKAPALTTSSDASILSISRAEEISELSHLCAPHNDFEDVIFWIRAGDWAREKGAARCWGGQFFVSWKWLERIWYL